MLESPLHTNNPTPIGVPGDKSVSHRSVLFSALCTGKSKISGFLEAEDPLNTMRCFSKLGVTYTRISPTLYEVTSPGKKYLTSPSSELDFGNGGTGIRLSAGLIAGLPGIRATLTGDASLLKRPMKRIIEPLRLMGAQIHSSRDNDMAPLEIQGRILKGFRYSSNLASAQVKSCLMLAAISSETDLDYEEHELSRDHTENMLKFLGGNLERLGGHRFQIRPPYNFQGTEFKVPGDISSAAFFIVFGLVSKGDCIRIQNIGLNPARTGILTVLRSMGARIEEENLREECGERTGDLLVYPSALSRVQIPESLLPSIIDEIPILTIAGLFSRGGFRIDHAEDLRAKESDRIHSMVSNLRKLGVEVEEFRDGYEFPEVSQVQPAPLESFMDHRIAMSFAILGKLLGKEIPMDDTSWIETSFPNFHEILRQF